MRSTTISTSVAHSACDVCGRTLLRGERAEIYVGGGDRHSVCELCTSRAIHTGWVREGTIPDYDAGARVDRRRSLFSRLRPRREVPERVEEDYEPTFDDQFEESPVSPVPPPVRAEPPPRRAPVRRSHATREPRHVRAVPTSVEHKISSAADLFNNSEHPRTVAGITRSLGVPEVSVLPAAELGSVVKVVVAWELCWYRYEVDLSDEVPSLRVAAQGYELDELAPEERHYNAFADDRGKLSL
ncbi:MAG: hypothetical protein ACLPTJ_06435 [Solirubrobacteraceae bacterium]